METLSERVDFAEELLGLAVAEASVAYGDLVEGFRRDDQLRLLVVGHGVAAALASDAVGHKGANREVVTAADQRAEAAMRAAVRARFPTDSITGEEWGDLDAGPWRWVFDPIDGTSAMIRCALAQSFGLTLPSPAPGFGVMIGLLEGDRPAAGVVGRLEPDGAGAAGAGAAGVGAAGAGAAGVGAAGAGEAGVGAGLGLAGTWVGVTGRPTRRDGVVVAPVVPRPPERAVLACTVPEVMFSRQPGRWRAAEAAVATVERDQNCVGFLRLLGGGVDAVLERDLAIYDVAALVPILAGAGVRVTDLAGDPLRLGADHRHGEFAVLAAAPPLHGRLLATIGAVPPEAGEGSAFEEGYARKF